MPNYYDYNRSNEYPIQKNSQSDRYYAAGEARRDRSGKVSDDLIIDDNSVYEIDPDCYEKVKQMRLNQRQDWNRK
ncbi:hypothetical protein QA584_12080 [Anaerocolumna sp. AGMB13025]|uniref:hypothetical protein n=1 Tax=Anaerocolumna sp. AGMB13025 TaxID=3039116 RepID=UPI00241CE96F|nr:hypothetical protein [Anaerocolumna sp. AGMB13025]WFR59785.1 hypothetical protein QA584_12080 [Anaerocolumna sp. AGMB13025]